MGAGSEASTGEWKLQVAQKLKPASSEQAKQQARCIKSKTLAANNYRQLRNKQRGKTLLSCAVVLEENNLKRKQTNLQQATQTNHQATRDAWQRPCLGPPMSSQWKSFDLSCDAKREKGGAQWERLFCVR